MATIQSHVVTSGPIRSTKPKNKGAAREMFDNGEIDEGQAGPWRVLIDHWHLRAPEAWADDDAERFAPRRTEFERSQWTGGLAYTPRQVIMWVNATREKLIRVHEISPELLATAGYGSESDRVEMWTTERKLALAGRDVRGSLDIAGLRAVTWSAYGMNPRQCRVAHADAPAAMAVR